jgi:Rad3-related DNA helicase
MKPIKISVNKIIDLIMRSGDIDGRFIDSAAMHQGSGAHRKIQKQQRESGKNYQHEVSLRHETEIDGIPIVVQGRADGIITEADGSFTIDEIKTTTLSLEQIFKQRFQHLAQGKCYAFMYLQGMENPPERVSVQLTYFQLESKEIQRHSWDFTLDELSDFFGDLIEKFARWLRFERDWKVLRDESIKDTPFPYATYRKGQREMAVATYHTISAQKKLYVSAPTGIGKTLSAIFPAIKAMGKGKTDKLFYLTAKTIARTVAEDAVGLMAARGLRFKSITLRAKEKICPKDECICNPDYCSYAKGHYDRANDALMDMLENNDIINPDITMEYSRKHQVCPYELQLDATLYCDLVIGDYNHVFDPVVYLHRFFSGEKKYEDKNYVFLIDEAHNLVERARDMYSMALSKKMFAHIRTRLKDKGAPSKELRKILRQIDAHLADLRNEYEETRCHVQQEQDMGLAALLGLFSEAAANWLGAKKMGSHPMFEEILKLHFEVTRFLLISGMYDESCYATIIEISGTDAVVTLFCLDPSAIIAKKLEMGKASIIFSATLAPLPYYREILGGSSEDTMLSLPSPFDPERLLTILHAGISTKYVDRESSYIPIAGAINSAVSHKKGNYMCFFPSYEYMHRVHNLFCEEFPNVKTLMQKSGMTEEARIEFLAQFNEDNPETLVGFVVLGGIFSEGVDLAGDRLIGSIIISVGIPKISLRQNLIRSYFDQKNGQGYDYAYTFPGMNKVTQAAGRVIRTEADSGLIALIDSRYATAKYRQLMPAHWSNMHLVRNPKELKLLIQAQRE